MSEKALQSSVISLSDAYTSLVVEGHVIEVEFAGGQIIVRSGIVKLEGRAQFQNSAATAKVGDVVGEGPNKGWIYCETEQGETFLVAPKDSGVMKWREAMDYAAREKSELPSREQLSAMYEARNTGALKRTFYATSAYPFGWYWSGTEYEHSNAWCQRSGDGLQYTVNKYDMSSVRCVRRCSII